MICCQFGGWFFHRILSWLQGTRSVKMAVFDEL
jgi:hypothetical protein